METNDVRKSIGRALFERVAGPDSDGTHRKIHETAGPRWFDETSAVRRVHGDASMFVGGIRALLLQSLHPLAMAGVAGHSGYKGDPWGRLQRTSYYVAVTTFGTIADAEEAIARVQSVHTRVKGVLPDGRAYSASDPHLLKWVHIAEIDSFLKAHQLYGARPLDQAGRDAYVSETALVAEKLGVNDPPLNEAELASQLSSYEPELESTNEAKATARYLLFNGPIPFMARGPYSMLGAAAVEMLTPRQRSMLGMFPILPGTNVLVRSGGDLVTATIRWALSG